MTAPGAHTFSISERADKRFVGSPMRHRAECDCGWVSGWLPTPERARAEGYAHQALADPPDLGEAA